MESGGKAQHIPNPCISYRGVSVLHCGRLTSRKEAPVPIGQKGVWVSEPVRTLWKREKSLAPD
jgi:hypothetical protein